MTRYLEDSIELARAWDAARPRTQQKAVGWSGMADCRAYLGYQLNGTWPTDEPDKVRAIAGSALHDHWWTGLRRAWCRKRGIAASFGVPVSYGGVGGHIDEVLWPSEPGGRWEVTDWKFPTLGSVRLWADTDFLNEMFVQPNGYAAGVLEPDAREYASARVQPMPWADHPSWLDPDACIVRLIGFPVDAKTVDDWDCQERPFSREVADDALARLADVAAAVDDPETGEWPPSFFRDKPFFFCEKWCEFATACRGDTQPRELELITDPELKAAIAAYGLASELIAANTKIKKELRPVVEDARGVTPDGWKIYPSRGAKAKLEFDDQAVEAALGSRGIPLRDVTRMGPAGKPHLNVKRA